mgnify:CR=1 FL=1
MSPDEAHELALLEVSRWQREAWRRMYGLEQDDSVDDDRCGARDGDLGSGVVARESDGNLPAGRELCDVREDYTVKRTVAIVGVIMLGLSGCCTSTLDPGCDPQPKWSGYRLEKLK